MQSDSSSSSEISFFDNLLPLPKPPIQQPSQDYPDDISLLELSFETDLDSEFSTIESAEETAIGDQR